ARIRVLLDRDHQIGHSYFMTATDMKSLRFVWYNRVIPLLQEYFYGDTERLRAVLGSAFITEQKPDARLFDTALDIIDPDRTLALVELFDGDDTGFMQALQQLAGTTNATASGSNS
ncbi:MAG: hypothetical protein M3R24_38770, partial [Chloroflexota bacterium]|nr:hypothetical protein [Chloroflexota bacterium]